MHQDLKDRSGRLIGKIRERTDGRLEVRDAGGRLKGIYDPGNNTTKDAAGRLVGKGNLLTALLSV